VLAVLLLGGLAVASRGCREDPTRRDLKDLEKAYYALRDAILQGDDEAFFQMHSAEARAWAVSEFPGLRATYVASGDEQRRAFEKTFHVGSKEFLESEPRVLVVKMMPWRSGWRDNREMLRSARVRDASFEYRTLPDGGTERLGIVSLEPADPSARGRPEDLPTVVLVKDPEGWRRQSFFLEVRPIVEAPPRPGR
jgi:hypothetical protein